IIKRSWGFLVWWRTSRYAVALSWLARICDSPYTGMLRQHNEPSPHSGLLICRPDPVLNLLTDGRIHILPVLEDSFQHLRLHATQQAAYHLLNKLFTLRIIPDLAHQDARLAEIIVFCMQGIRAAHQFAVGFPAIGHGACLV